MVMDMAKRSIDRRVARTRTTLHRALMSLIMTKGYESITVEDICESANVGRSTFYTHYTDKDDLMRSGLEHLRARLMDHQRDAAERDAEHRALGFSLPMFEHTRDHMHLFRALVGSRGGAIALGTIRQVLSDLVRGELATDASKKAKEAIPSEIVVQYVVGAYMAVLTWWLDGGAKLPPQRIDAMFRRLASEGVAASVHRGDHAGL
jgi:AcrR family transcriptional regulator